MFVPWEPPRGGRHSLVREPGKKWKGSYLVPSGGKTYLMPYGWTSQCPDTAPAAPDLGIPASTDIPAVDQASVDMIYALPENQRHDLVERIKSRGGLRQLSSMREQGMGNHAYDLITL